MFRGGYFLCLARNGVLMAFCGLLLLGGIGIPPPMQHAVRGGLARFAGVLWYSVFARCVAALFFPVLIVAAWTLPGPLDMPPPQIVLTGPAMLRGRGPNPGRDSACHSAHGVERVKRLRALDLVASRRKSLQKSPDFARKSLIVAKPCINPGKSLPLLRKLLNSR